jgi:hypothetical protein
MTVSYKLGIAAPAGSAGPRLVPKTAEGFPRNNMRRLMLFKQAAPYREEVDSIDYPTQIGGGGGLTALSGGGLQISGLAWVAGPSINIQEPWTLMFGLTQPAPAGATAADRRTWFWTAGYSTRGFMAWNNPVSGEISTNSGHGVFMRQSVSGVEPSVWPGIPKPHAAQYGKPQSVIMRHHGGGNISIQQRRSTVVAQVSAVWDMAAITGPSGNQQSTMAINIGSYDTFAGGSTIMDAFEFCEGRAITEREIAAFHTAHVALAATRGRS